VTPQLAIAAQLGGTSFWDDVGGNSEQFLNGFYGVTAQYWLNPRWLSAEGWA
jgi:hypothetical protein